jgi:hypothetical protein
MRQCCAIHLAQVVERETLNGGVYPTDGINTALMLVDISKLNQSLIQT